MTTTSPMRLRWHALLPALIPAVLAVAVFSPAITSGFSMWDDQIQIVLNPFVRSRLPLGQQLINLLGRDVGAFVHVRLRGGVYYRPLMQLAYWAEYRIWGLTAWAFHLVSLLLNGVAAFLAFLVLKELLTGKRAREAERSAATWAACAGATMFAVHPLHAEVAVWLAALPELQFTIFYLLAFWLYLRVLADRNLRRRWVWVPQLAGLALLAYLSKEMAATLPLLVGLHLCLLTRWPWNKRTILLRCSLLAPFVLMAIAYLGIRYWALGGRLGLQQPQQVTWKSTLLSAPTLYGTYWLKIIFPYPLSLAYPFRPTDSLAEPFLWLGLATLGVAGCLLIKGFRLAAFGILWVGVTLLPALNIRGVGDDLPITDRYSYLPALGLSILIAIAWRHVTSASGNPRVGWAFRFAVAGLICCFAGLGVTRARQWNDPVELFSDAVKRAPAFWLYLVLGNTLLSQERWQESLVAFRKTLEVGRGAALRGDAHNGMAFARLQLGDLEGSKRELERALLLSPNSQYARYNMALVQRELGDLAEARKQVEICLRINPYSIEAHVLAGQVAVAQLDHARARRSFERALRLDPNNQEARAQLAAMAKQE